MGLTGLRPSSGKIEHSKSFKHKLDKKLDFYAKVKESVVSLGAKKAITKKKRLRSRQKKLKAYDLSTLSELLPNLDGLQQSPDATKLKLNCKSRQKLVEKEGKQLRAVLNHPAFQVDPLAAIHQHLASTQPPTVGKQEKRPGKTRKKAKRKGTKGPSCSQSMEI